MKLVLATANPGKIKEMSEILSDLGIGIVTRDHLGIDIDVKETGKTFLENAGLKAEAICAASGMPAIADDSGLVVEALGGEPGVYSSTYGGEGLTSKKRCKYLLNKMEGVKHRGAKFVCTVVCVFPDGVKIMATGESAGSISTELQGIGGFGYDPVFIPDGKEKTMAELSSVEKNAISHRGIALRIFSKKLESYKAGTYE